MLVRDEFPGKRFVNALIDLPFALPTIVAGLTLLALYGPKGPAPFDIGFTRIAVVLALLFVTLPFVVRPSSRCCMELDREMEEAADVARRAAADGLRAHRPAEPRPGDRRRRRRSRSPARSASSARSC